MFVCSFQRVISRGFVEKEKNGTILKKKMVTFASLPVKGLCAYDFSYAVLPLVAPVMNIIMLWQLHTQLSSVLKVHPQPILRIWFIDVQTYSVV